MVMPVSCRSCRIGHVYKFVVVEILFDPHAKGSQNESFLYWPCVRRGTALVNLSNFVEKH